MNVISRKVVIAFYNARPARRLHAAAFEAWFKLTKKARWSDFQDLKNSFGQSDVARGIGGTIATIFDIGGNKYRIVARVDYLRQTVKIVAIMDHAEYDRQLWKKFFYRRCNMAVTTAPRRTRKDSYLELVKKFPLKTLKNDDEHDRACEMVDKLMGYDIDPGAGDYLDALIVLVTKFEDERYPIKDDLTPQQALRALMDFNQLTQADIGKIIGSEPAVSMFFKGTRSLSKRQAKLLSEQFKVDLSLFI